MICCKIPFKLCGMNQASSESQKIEPPQIFTVYIEGKKINNNTILIFRNNNKILHVLESIHFTSEFTFGSICKWLFQKYYNIIILVSYKDRKPISSQKDFERMITQIDSLKLDCGKLQNGDVFYPINVPNPKNEQKY